MIPVLSLGIDLSCTATGLVALSGPQDTAPELVLEEEVGFPKLRGQERQKAVALALMSQIHQLKPDIIVLEGYSLSMKNAASIIPTVELGGLLRFLMYLDNLSWYAPQTQKLKQFVTGKGNSDKARVMLDVHRRWGHSSQTNNTADAYGLACMGLARMGALPGATKEMQKIAQDMPSEGVALLQSTAK